MSRGASATVPEEDFIAPFSIPTSIPRFYFAFRKPIQLKKEDLDTEGRCDELYNQVRLSFNDVTCKLPHEMVWIIHCSQWCCCGKIIGQCTQRFMNLGLAITTRACLSPVHIMIWI